MVGKTSTTPRTYENTPVAGTGYGVDPLDPTVTHAFRTNEFGELYVRDKTLAILKTSSFGELATYERTPVIELNSSYGISALRDQVTIDGNTATVTPSEGEIILDTGNGAFSCAKVASAEVGRYLPGTGAEIGVGIRLDPNNPPTGNQQIIWGGLSVDNQNGLYWGKDSTDFFVAVLRGGIEQKVYRTDFNIDKLDGNGLSGFGIDESEGRIFQILFSWYGYGSLLFGVTGTPPNNNELQRQEFIPAHQFSGFEQTSIASPNLRVFVQADNADQADSPIRAYLGGRQYAIFGRYVPKYRITSEFRGSVSANTTVKPLVSFVLKDAFKNRSIKLDSFDSISTQQPMLIQIRLDGTLNVLTNNFVTPTDHTASETALVSDKTATTITGGQVLYEKLVASGGGNQTTTLASEDLDFDLPEESIVTLCVRTIEGTGTIISCFRMKEEW